MRIEIAPWRHVETSLLSSDSLEEESALIRAAFVESFPPDKQLGARKRRSKGKEDDDKDNMVEKERRRPLLTLTTSRQAITIVEDEEHPLNPLHESSLLSYRSRPGASFLSPPRPLNGDISTLPCIPSVYDVRSHRCFAVQKKNTHLICFFNGETSDVSFESAIISLSILHLPRSAPSAVYGTCANGKFFMVTCQASETGTVPSMRVQYWDAPILPEHSAHMLTSASCRPTSPPPSLVRKRTANDLRIDSIASVLFILVDQIYCTSAGIITIARQYISLDSETMYPVSADLSESYVNSCTQRFLPIPVALKSSKPAISNMRVLGYLVSSEVAPFDSLVISYALLTGPSTPLSPTYPLKNGSNSKMMPTPCRELHSSLYYSIISLSKGVSPPSLPRDLPSLSCHTFLISSNLLAVVTKQREMYLYDVLRGGVVYHGRFPLPNPDARPIQYLSLRSQLAVLYSNGSRYGIATTSIGRIARMHAPAQISLASGLAASLSVPPLPDLGFNVEISRTLCRDESSQRNPFGVHHRSKLTKSLALLKLLYLEICESSNECLQQSYLSTKMEEVFQCAISIVKLPQEDFSNTMKSADNPQDAVISKNGQKMTNGFHSMDVNAKSQVTNGRAESPVKRLTDLSQVKNRPYQLADLPQVLIDTSMRVIVATLRKFPSDNISTMTIRNEARILLRRLVRSGKVLARHHFYAPVVSDSDEVAVYGCVNFLKLLQSLELSSSEATQDHFWSSYTPYDMICDMFQFCPDLSEREMVMALRYSLFLADPRDIASFFARSKSLPDDQSLRKRCVYWSETMKISESSILKPYSKYKIVLAGATFLITQMAQYSHCNMSLLRDAYHNEFQAIEMNLVLELSIDILSDSKQVGLPFINKDGTKNMLQHVATLCDCLDIFLRDSAGVDNSDVASVKSTLERVRNVVRSISSATTTLCALQRLIPDPDNNIPPPNSPLTERLHTSEEKHRTPIKSSTALPPYQIERLLF